MDLDIGFLQALLSPYVAVFEEGGALAPSEDLLGRFGPSIEEVRKAVDAMPSPDGAASAYSFPLSLRSPTGEDIGLSCTVINLDRCRVLFLEEPRSAQRPLFPLEDRDIFVRMFANSPVAAIAVDKGLIAYANDRFSRIMDMGRDALLGRELSGFVSRHSLNTLLGASERWCADDGAPPEPVEVMFVTPSGRRVRMEVRGGCTERRGRKVVWMVMTDLSRVESLERRLAEERQRYEELFDKMPIGILYVDPRGRIVECNRAVSTMTGFPAERIRGFLFTEFVDDEQADELRDAFGQLFAHGHEITRREGTIKTAGGRTITIEYDARPIYRKGRCTMALMVFTDVTAKKALERELIEKNEEMERTLWDMAEVKDALEARAGELNRATEELKLLNEKLNLLSITDGLTELYNHRHFQDRLTEELERLNRAKDGSLSLLMIDIDDFKSFNDTYGHQCGDMVLKHISFLIKSTIRSIDIVARYGGEEFAVILPNATKEQALLVAERICQVIRSTPFSYGGASNAKVTVSIGVGTVDKGVTDKSMLVARADEALYSAKAKWKDRVEVWEDPG